MKTTIIIPTWNRADLLDQLLSCDGMQNVGCPILIVDNGSTDDTQAIIVKHRERLWLYDYRSATNLGYAKGCNRGAQALALSSAIHPNHYDYICFLNNDTIPHMGWLDTLETVLDERPEVGMVGPKLLYPDGRIQSAGIKIFHRHHGGPQRAEEMFRGKPGNYGHANEYAERPGVTGACVLLRYAQFVEIGGYDEGYYNGYEDVDMCLQYQRKGWQIIYQPAAVVTHIESASGPERFVRKTANRRRLNEKWKNWAS